MDVSIICIGVNLVVVYGARFGREFLNIIAVWFAFLLGSKSRTVSWADIVVDCRLASHWNSFRVCCIKHRTEMLWSGISMERELIEVARVCLGSTSRLWSRLTNLWLITFSSESTINHLWNEIAETTGSQTKPVWIDNKVAWRNKWDIFGNRSTPHEYSSLGPKSLRVISSDEAWTKRDVGIKVELLALKLNLMDRSLIYFVVSCFSGRGFHCVKIARNCLSFAFTHVT